MTENKEIKKEKKTLSLKLGSKPIISNKRGIEAGKTVIVEKKGIKEILIQIRSLNRYH